jgi:hypothetical protein
VIDHAAWQQGNDEYLGLALSWLRARLDAISPSAPLPSPVVVRSHRRSA